MSKCAPESEVRPEALWGQMERALQRLQNFNHSDKALVIIALASAAQLVFVAAAWGWLSGQSLSRVFDAGYLSKLFALQLVVFLIFVFCFLWCLGRRGREKTDNRPFYLFAATATLSSLALINAVGTLSTPALVLFPFIFLGVCFLFDTAIARHFLLFAVAAILALGLLECSGIIPYAPVYAQHAFPGNEIIPGSYLYRFASHIFLVLLTFILAAALLLCFQSVKNHKEELNRLRSGGGERKRGAEYDNAVISSGQVLFDWDPETDDVFFGGDIKKVLGYELKEVKQGLAAWVELIHPDDRLYFQTMFAQLKATNNPAPLEYRVRTKAGDYRFLEHNGLSILDSSGRKTRVIGFVKDVTDRKQAKENLVKSEFKYKSLLSTLPDLVYQIDADGIFVLVSDASKHLLGYDKSELIGQHFSKIIHPDDIDRVSRAKVLPKFSGKVTGQRNSPKLFDERRTGDRKTKGLEVKLVPKANQKFIRAEIWSKGLYGEVASYGIYNGQISNENFIGSVGVIRDITQRKRLEAQLRQAQKMEAIGTLAGGIAHDFNNILAPIMGYSEMVLEDLPQGSRAKENLEEVLISAHRAREIVKQILTFSRVKDEKQEKIDIIEIIRDSEKLIRASLPANIEIRTELAPQGGLVMGDSTQIHQVVMNLCTNAYQVMSATGGVLEIMLRYEEIVPSEDSPLLKPGKYAVMTVSDTGCGMEPDVLERIFEPYFTTKEVGEGTGMGLAVTHAIVTKHDGHLSVKSVVGKGSTFEVHLPVVDGFPHSRQAQRREASLPGDESILLIDDEMPVLIMVTMMLEKLGYEVTPTTSPEDALKAFSARPDQFDLVITDMTMPKMTGDMLAKEVMAIRPDIPVMLCTGYSENFSKEKAKEKGIAAYLMKPVIMAEMSRVIRQALDRE